jgi:substrate import-associated zinc metallohydrolase lipoprotein
MKTTATGLLWALATAVFLSCSGDGLQPGTIIKDSAQELTAFDLWLKENYTDAYNIDFKYKWDDGETMTDYNLVPPTLASAAVISRAIKHLWLEAYDEATGGAGFMRQYAPRVILLIGSPALSPRSGTMILGQAEGGVKITLFLVNYIDVTDLETLNDYYFRTMHHEFAHVLHQTKPYPNKEYDIISAGKYTAGAWINLSDAEARQRGFVTPYGSSEPREDFVELISTYLLQPAGWWQEMLDGAGDFGRPAIEQKLAIAAAWLKTSWNIDIDRLRDIIKRRSDEIMING